MRSRTALRKTGGVRNPSSLKKLRPRQPAPRREDGVEQVVQGLARMRIRPRIDVQTKTIDTAAGALPISPLMDEAHLAARSKYADAKPAPDKSKHGRLEKQLAKNPYAWALAGPVRMDPVTGTFLPRFFLQDFQFMSHPSTGEPWFVPCSVLPHHSAEDGAEPAASSAANISPPTGGRQGGDTGDSSGSTQPRNSSPRRIEAVGADATFADEASSSDWDLELQSDGSKGDGHHEPAEAPLADGVGRRSAAPRTTPRLESPSAYTLARHDLLEAISTGADKRYKGKYFLLAALARQGRAVWRRDMDAFVLQEMRARATDLLLHTARLCDPDRGGGDGGPGRQRIVRCASDSLLKEEWGAHSDRGCVLWLGGGAESATRAGEFATVRIAGVKHDGAMPVHDLNRLLGAENLQKLRAEITLFSRGTVFLVRRTGTTRLQLRLWKLQGYLVEYPDYR